MTKKNLLDVTTKGWSEEDLQELKKTIDSQNFRKKAQVITKDGKKKYCYFYSKVDLEIAAKQQGFKILKVQKL